MSWARNDLAARTGLGVLRIPDAGSQKVTSPGVNQSPCKAFLAPVLGAFPASKGGHENHFFKVHVQGRRVGGCRLPGGPRGDAQSLAHGAPRQQDSRRLADQIGSPRSRQAARDRVIVAGRRPSSRWLGRMLFRVKSKGHAERYERASDKNSSARNGLGKRVAVPRRLTWSRSRSSPKAVITMMGMVRPALRADSAT